MYDEKKIAGRFACLGNVNICMYMGHFTRLGHVSVTWHLSLKLCTDFISKFYATLGTR